MSEPDPIPWFGTTATPPALSWAGGVGVLPPVPPPLADSGWLDPVATYEAVLVTLRITQSDPDAAGIMAAMSSAVELVNQYLDRRTPLPGPPPPAPVQTAVEQLTVELYRRKDAPFNILNATVPEDVPVDITGVGSIQSVAPLLQPYKQRWGFA